MIETRTLAMSALGRLGRFGNQVFQYAFLRITANASGAIVQCPAWIGSELFGHKDAPVTRALTPLVESSPNMDSLLEVIPEVIEYLEKATGIAPQPVGVEAMSSGAGPGDLVGFFQFHTSAFKPHKDFFRSLFQPSEHIRDWAEEPVARLRSQGKTVVAIHFRTGDYKWLPQFDWTLIAPPHWWVDWLESVWDTLDEPVLYICGNDARTAKKWFGRYNPMTSDDFTLATPQGVESANGSFYRDFYVMSQADVLGISNSTFSFSAAMLNERARLFVRPHWNFSTRFEQFDPWDSDPLLFHGERPGSARMKYTERVRTALELGGIRGALADALIHYPAGTATVAAMRARLSYETRGLRGIFGLLTRPARGQLTHTTRGSA